MILSKAEISSGGYGLTPLSNMIDGNISTYVQYTYLEKDLSYKWLRIKVHLEKESLIWRVVVNTTDTFELLDDAQVRVIEGKDEWKEGDDLCTPDINQDSDREIEFECNKLMLGDSVVIEKYVTHAPDVTRVEINEIVVYGTDKPKRKPLTHLQISMIVIGAVLGVLVLCFVINQLYKADKKRSDIDKQSRDHIPSVEMNSVAPEQTGQ